MQPNQDFFFSNVPGSLKVYLVYFVDLTEKFSFLIINNKQHCLREYKKKVLVTATSQSCTKPHTANPLNHQKHVLCVT